MSDTTRICLWSGPRNVSTALMYAFAQREDTRVIDEPLYAHYLRVSGADHPGRESVLASMDPDGDAVARDVILGPCDRVILFTKQMAHHLVDLDLSFLASTVNVLLIRDPRQMLPSLVNQLPDPTLRETGLARQAELYHELCALGQSPPILDAMETLLDPGSVLRQLCESIGISYTKQMLQWEAGPRSEDGVWAEHWYHNVHRSTGFSPYAPKTKPFPERLGPLLEACRPHYDRLYQKAIKANP
ncbi:TPA: sulfotransferase family protein [Candidatus Latescibacteria bacterium]|nr:sulfotransferase family protein [Candidatus Latescibacterota bacterium]